VWIEADKPLLLQVLPDTAELENQSRQSRSLKIAMISPSRIGRWMNRWRLKSSRSFPGMGRKRETFEQRSRQDAALELIGKKRRPWRFRFGWNAIQPPGPQRPEDCDPGFLDDLVPGPV
jgi:hypothetical protein